MDLVECDITEIKLNIKTKDPKTIDTDFYLYIYIEFVYHIEIDKKQ